MELKTVTEKSIVTLGNMTVFNRRKGELVETRAIPQIIANFEKHYSSDGHIILYVLGGRIYITPYTEWREKAVKEALFTKAVIATPFDEDEYPCEEWAKMLDDARKEREEYFASMCKKWCEMKGINELPPNVLSSLNVVDREPARFRTSSYTFVEVRAILVKRMDSLATAFLGKFAVHFNTVVIVYRDGTTRYYNGNNLEEAQLMKEVLTEYGYIEVEYNELYPNHG